MRAVSRAATAALLAFGFWVAAGVVIPGTSAVAAPAGGTSVALKGHEFTITVRIDMCCIAPHQVEAYQAVIAPYFLDAADVWNVGFAGLNVGCYRAKLMVDARVITKGAARPDAHQIELKKGVGRSFIKLLKGPDSTRPYAESVGGVFYLPHLYQSQAMAHEIGHLIGFGDDYRDVMVDGKKVSVSIPGREGTLMAVGDAIDQVLASRLENLLHDAKLLDPCEEWSGTIHQDATVSGCTTGFAGKVALTLANDRSVQGRMYDFDITSRCYAEQRISQTSFPLTGKKTRDVFQIKLVSPYVEVPPITIPTSNGRGRGTVTYSLGGGTITDVIEIHCDSAC